MEAGSCNNRKEGKKMKTETQKSHFRGKFGTILLVKGGQIRRKIGRALLRHILEVVSIPM